MRFSLPSSLICLFISLSSIAQYGWIRTIQSGDYGYAAAADQHGNLNFGGRFEGATSFNPSNIGDSAFCSQPNPFLLQYDSLGNLNWYKTWESVDMSYIIAIDTDPSGNIYCVGAFSDQIDLDPEAGSNLTQPGDGGIFISKFSSSGTLLWTNAIHNSLANSNSIIPRCISVNDNGNSFIGGEYTGSFDWDSGTGYAVHSVPNSGSSMFILHLDENGNFGWFSQFNGSGGTTSELYGISADNIGNTYVTGHFHEATDFDPSDDTLIENASGSSSSFLVKLDQTGNLGWIHALPASQGSDCQVYNTHVVFTGQFGSPVSETVDFDPGSGVHNVTSINMDTYFLNLDTSGNFNWVSIVSGDGTQSSRSMDITSDGYIYAAGRFDQNITYGNNLNVHFTSNTDTEYFICKMDSSGIFLEQYMLLGTGIAPVFNITHSDAGQTYIGGHYSGEVDLNVNPEVNNYNSIMGSFNPYVIKLGELNYANLHELSENEWTVYPNPTSGLLYISHPDYTQPIHIIDLNGTTVISIEHPASNSIPIDKLNAGSYVIQNGLKRSHFIKQ